MNRREFLKLAGLLTASSITPSINLAPSSPQQDQNAPNIIIFVFDTLSAEILSFYGYRRQTMPNLARLLNRATIFHQHNAGDNFTTPGTASLLTGTYPWSHRALKLLDTAAPEFENKNIFSLFDRYYRVAYTHNPAAEVLLNQFNQGITFHKLLEELYLNSTWWINNLFHRDADTAWLSWLRASDPEIDGLAYSLLFAEQVNKFKGQIPQEIKALFPRGVPENGQNFFILEHVIDWIQQQVEEFSQPFLGYFHVFPPHDPYRTKREFVDRFLDDGLSPPEKEIHHLDSNARQHPREVLLENRQLYDEFILYADAEFARLYNFMEQEGYLENTWIVITSDHGEMFERGTIGHTTPHLYQPLVRIPLVIFEPGQKTRKDIYTPTSCTDLLPTLLHVTGQTIPEWTEGDILPPYRQGEGGSTRRVYAYRGKLNPEKYGELVNGTMMMVGERYKAIRYFGFTEVYSGLTEMKSDPWYEVYDIFDDPEELDNLAVTAPARAKDVIEELERKFEEVRGPYIPPKG